MGGGGSRAGGPGLSPSADSTTARQTIIILA
ncbi:hypothetical protein VTN00DRAFT_3039 [Thermoascus crustaceus]